MKKLLLLLLLPLILGMGPINGGPINFGGAGQALDPGASPTFEDVVLTDLSDGRIPYHVNDTTGLADGPTKTDVDSAVSLKHAAVTIDGTSPLSLSTQAISLKNDAAAAVTEVDTGALAASDTVVPTSKAVKTVTDTMMLKTGSNLAIGSDANGDMYYRASSALARLAKGTAYYHMAMDAAGTAPTWRVSGGAVSSSSRAMDNATTDPAGSATIPISAGSNVVLVMSYLGGKFGIGFASRAGNQFNLVETSAGVWAPSSSQLITLYEAAGKTQTFAITSWSEAALNGTWTRTGDTAAGTGYFYVLNW
jgi:hypothetical protein